MKKSDKNHGHSTPCLHIYSAEDDTLIAMYDSFKLVSQKSKKNKHKDAIDAIVNSLDKVKLFMPDYIYDNGLAAGIDVKSNFLWTMCGICYQDKKILTLAFETKKSKKLSITILPELSLLCCELSGNIDQVSRFESNITK